MTPSPHSGTPQPTGPTTPDPIPLRALWSLRLAALRTLFSHGDPRPGFLLDGRDPLNGRADGLWFTDGNQRMTLPLSPSDFSCQGWIPRLPPPTPPHSPDNQLIRTRRSELFVFLQPPSFPPARQFLPRGGGNHFKRPINRSLSPVPFLQSHRAKMTTVLHGASLATAAPFCLINM